MPTPFHDLSQRVRNLNTINFMRNVETKSAIQKVMESMIFDVREGLEKAGKKMKDVFQSMATHEWYPDMEMYLDEIWIIGAEIKENPHEFNNRMTEYFRNRIDEIEKGLLKANPDRQHLISEGFGNHREGKYSSSILMFLTQADGIFQASFGASPFRSRSRNHASENPRLSDIISPLFLIRTLPIWIDENNRSPSFDGLNRHQVLHGEVLSYGTEENSLKAISFLGFINSLFDDNKADA